MILYVNGDSHTAGAEAVNSHVFAEDDPDLYHLGRKPHPDNLAVSWGQQLADKLKWEFWCDAESASSSDRIIRTTNQWLENHVSRLDHVIMIIQWSTWEREEWQHDGIWWQVNASGIDDVPKVLQERYRKFVIDVDWRACTNRAHQRIWQWHQQLKSQGIRHIFFNGNSHFAGLTERLDWQDHYLSPYGPDHTFDRTLKINGFKSVRPNSWHFGPDAHCFWADYMLQYMLDHDLISTHEISTD